MGDFRLIGCQVGSGALFEFVRLEFLIFPMFINKNRSVFQVAKSAAVSLGDIFFDFREWDFGRILGNHILKIGRGGRIRTCESIARRFKVSSL